EVSLGISRVRSDGLLVGGAGLVQLSLLPETVAEITVGPGHGRVEFDGPGEASHGLVRLLLPTESQSQVIPGRGAARAKRSCGDEVTNGHFKSRRTSRRVEASQIKVNPEIARVYFAGSLQQGTGLLGLRGP